MKPTFDVQLEIALPGGGLADESKLPVGYDIGYYPTLPVPPLPAKVSIDYRTLTPENDFEFPYTRHCYLEFSFQLWNARQIEMLAREAGNITPLIDMTGQFPEDIDGWLEACEHAFTGILSWRIDSAETIEKVPTDYLTALELPVRLFCDSPLNSTVDWLSALGELVYDLPVVMLGLGEQTSPAIKSAAPEMLRSLGRKQLGIHLVSCPTCARCHTDMRPLVQEAEERLRKLPTKKNLEVAIMGCEVNGPGEARMADLGLAFGPEGALLFRQGKIIRSIPEAESLDQLIDEINDFPIEEADQ